MPKKTAAPKKKSKKQIENMLAKEVERMIQEHLVEGLINAMNDSAEEVYAIVKKKMKADKKK
jgi:hypothetical protein